MECQTPILHGKIYDNGMALKMQPWLSMLWWNCSFRMLKFLNQPFTASPPWSSWLVTRPPFMFKTVNYTGA